MIDDANMITLDRAEDSFLPFEWIDENNQPIDLSALTVAFIVKGGFTLVPGAHPENTRARLLHFTPDHAASLGNKAREYMVHAELSDGTEKVLWRGVIIAEGFAAS